MAKNSNTTAAPETTQENPVPMDLTIKGLIDLGKKYKSQVECTIHTDALKARPNPEHYELQNVVRRAASDGQFTEIVITVDGKTITASRIDPANKFDWTFKAPKGVEIPDFIGSSVGNKKTLTDYPVRIGQDAIEHVLKALGLWETRVTSRGLSAEQKAELEAEKKRLKEEADKNKALLKEEQKKAEAEYKAKLKAVNDDIRNKKKSLVDSVKSGRSAEQPVAQPAEVK